MEADGIVYTIGRVVYEEKFKDASSIWVEGNPENVRIENGHLTMNANLVDEPVLTVFIDNVFRGGLYFEYEARVASSDTAARHAPPRNVNNINTFLYYSDPSGACLKETRTARSDAAYGRYHDLNGYIVTFLNGWQDQVSSHARNPERFRVELEKNTARIRMRECPGFVLRNESFKYKSEIGRTYKMQFLFSGAKLLFFVDDEFMLGFEVSEDKLFHEGYFAFRAFGSELAVSNFNAREITGTVKSN